MDNDVGKYLKTLREGQDRTKKEIGEKIEANAYAVSSVEDSWHKAPLCYVAAVAKELGANMNKVEKMMMNHRRQVVRGFLR